MSSHESVYKILQECMIIKEGADPRVSVILCKVGADDVFCVYNFVAIYSTVKLYKYFLGPR